MAKTQGTLKTSITFTMTTTIDIHGIPLTIYEEEVT
jgi:hypothetical protein